jgi:predicted 2-oxoglutarate/Fe(II)-dependent dioxygenase YbiX
MIITKTIPNFLTKIECDNLLNIGKNLTLEYAATGTETNPNINKKIRDSEITWINDENISNKIIRELTSLIKIKGFEVVKRESFQFTKYGKDGHYNWHRDSDKTIDNERHFSISIQLNEGYEGGELLYKLDDNVEIEFQKGLGNLYIFTSSILHCVKPVIDGERYSIVNWFGLEEIREYKKTLI